MGWNYLFIPKLPRQRHRSLGMYKYVWRALDNPWLFMIHVVWKIINLGNDCFFFCTLIYGLNAVKPYDLIQNTHNEHPIIPTMTILLYEMAFVRIRRLWSKFKLNTLRPRQNGRYFADDIFKCIFLNENFWISLKISLKSVPKGSINNIPALVQIMACADQATSH